jgi:hypothetical protein
MGDAVTNPAFPDFGNPWRDLLRQWEDAGKVLGTDAMNSSEFDIVLLSHGVAQSRGQMEMYGVADVC